MSLFHKKKALVLFGSPHSHGHTARLLESFLECFRRHGGWEVEVVDLTQLAPHPCTGCKACAKEERCAYPDLDALDKSLRACDLLVVASPVYNFSFPAPVKACVDRTQRYFEARFALGEEAAHPQAPPGRAAADHGLPGRVRRGGVHPPAGAGLLRDEHHLSPCAVWDATDRGGERKAGAQAAARQSLLKFWKNVI